MKQNLKRLVVVLMVISILISCLAGCGETTPETTETPTATETPSVTATPVMSTYTVYFEGGDGSGDAPDSITLEAGEIFTVPENTFSLSGYTFYGFWTGWDYIFPGDTYEMITQDLYFTAQWTKTTTYSSGGGGGSSSSSSSSSSSTTTTKTPLSSPTLTVVDGVISWDAVSYASSYTINIDGTDLDTTQTTTSYSSFDDNKAHTIKVKANAATGSISYNDSSYSSSLTVAKDGLVSDVDYILLSSNISLSSNVEILNDVIVSSSSEDLSITFDGYTLTIKGDLTINMPSTSGTLNLGSTSDADTSKLIVDGDFVIDATSTHVNQNVAITAESVELSVASESYIQNKTLSTTSTSSGITVSEGKFQQNTTINTTDISLNGNSKYELPSNSTASSIPTLTITSGVNIAIEKSDIDVEIVPTEEGMTIDLSNVSDDTQIIISGDNSVEIETNSDLTIVNNTTAEITYEGTIISTDEAIKIDSSGDEKTVTTVTAVVVSGITATDKVYDTETTVELSAYEYSYGTEGKITFTAALIDANVGLNKEILFMQTSTNDDVLVTFSKVYATVTQATPTIESITATEITYGDMLASSTLSGTSSVEGTFSWKNAAEVPTVSQSGSVFDVIFTPNSDNYASISATASVTVNKADYDMTGVSMSDKTVTYNTEEQTIAITGTLLEGVTVAYAGSGTNVGVYTITASFTGADSSNYNTIADKTATLTIEQASIDVSGASWSYTSAYTYDGTVKTVELTNIPDGVSVVYNGNNESTTGSYTASAAITATDSTNYQISGAVEDLTWEIEKANPIYSIPTNITATYGETLADVASTEGFAFVDDSSTSVGNAGTNSFEATYTPTDTDNYNVVSNLTISIEVAKAEYTDIPHDNIYVTYSENMTLADITLSDNFSWQDSTAAIISGANSYAAIYNADSTNYNDFNLEIKIIATESGSYEIIDGITYQANEDGTEYSIVNADSSFSDASKVLTSVNGIDVTSIDMYVFNGTAYYSNSDNWTDGALYIGTYLITVSSSAPADFTIKTDTTLIADVAFHSASNISSISIAETNAYFTTVDGVLYNKDKSRLIAIPQSKTGTYTMPDTVTSIETGAFTKNYLDEITSNSNFYYENGVLFETSAKTTIVGMARYGFDDYSYTIPSSVTTIEDYAFSSGYSLRALYIPSTVTYIGERGIMCNTGSNIYIEGGIKDSWDEWWTSNAGSEIFVVEEGMLETAQTLITLDSGIVLQQINSTDYVVTLYDITKSTNKYITVSDYADYNVVAIAGFAFDTTTRYAGENYYTDITSIEFPDSVTRIGACAFNNSYSLKEVVIGDGVTYISYSAFAGCGNLTSVYIPSTVEYIVDEIFESCNENLVIYVDLASEYVSENWYEDWSKSGEEYEYTILYSGDGDFYTIVYENIETGDSSNNPQLVVDLETFFLENATTETEDRYFLGWTIGQWDDYDLGTYHDTTSPAVWGGDDFTYECLEEYSSLIFYANWSDTDPLADSQYIMDINITDEYNTGTFAIYTSIDDEENGFYLLKVEDGDPTSGYLRAYAVLEDGYVLGEAYLYDEEYLTDAEFYADIKSDLAMDNKTYTYGGEYYGFTATVIPVSEATVSEIDHVVVSYEYYNANLEYVYAEYTYYPDDTTLMLSDLEAETDFENFNRNDIIGFNVYDASGEEIEIVSITAYSEVTKNNETYSFTTSIGEYGGYSMNNFDSYPNEGSSLYFEIKGIDGYSTISSTMTSVIISNMVQDTWEIIDDVYYRIITADDDGSSAAIVCGYFGDATKLAIPSTITISGIEYTVSQIAESAFNGASFEEIELPSTITYIGNYAFYNCYNLTSITIPEGVTYIGDRAFRNCGNLESIEIPKSVTYIGNYAFYNCSSLSSVTIAGDPYIGYRAFDNTEVYNDIDEYGITYFGTIVVSYDDSVATDVVIKDGTTQISAYLFENSDVASVSIPASVTSIGEYAFLDCDDLETITVAEESLSYSSENGVLYNKDKTELVAYPSSYGETSYTIPATVSEIASGALAFNNLTEIIVADGNTTYTSDGNVVFADNGKTIVAATRTGYANDAYTILETVTTIVDYGFCAAYGLDSLYVPSTVTTVGINGIHLNSGSNIYIEGGVKSGWSTYWTSNGGTEVFTVASLVDAQTYITLISGIQLVKIADNEYIIVNFTQTDRPDDWNWNDEPIYVDITVNSYEGYNITGIAGRAFAESQTPCYCYYTIELPSTITRISTQSFNCAYGATKIIINDGVTEIGYDAFAGGINLECIYIPNSVEYLESGVFEVCNEDLIIYLEYSEAEVESLIANGSWDEDWAESYDDYKYDIIYSQADIPTE